MHTMIQPIQIVLGTFRCVQLLASRQTHGYGCKASHRVEVVPNVHQRRLVDGAKMSAHHAKLEPSLMESVIGAWRAMLDDTLQLGTRFASSAKWGSMTMTTMPPLLAHTRT